MMPLGIRIERDMMVFPVRAELPAVEWALDAAVVIDLAARQRRAAPRC